MTMEAFPQVVVMIQHTRATAGVVRWPLDARPRIVTAGCFPLADRDFAATYRGPTHALHLHDYHGTIDLGGCVLPLTPGMVTLSPANRPSRYDLPIKAVAIQVGLADPQHFNKQFRRVVGVSPTAYRNQGGGIWK